MAERLAGEVGFALGRHGGVTVQFVLIAATWATSFLFLKLAVSDGLPPFILATVRAAFAGMAIAAWLVISGAGLRLPPAKVAIALGILNGLIPNILLAIALSRIDSAPAALLQATTPIFVAIGGHLGLANERLTVKAIVAIVASLGGLWLVIGPSAIADGGATWIGVAAVLGGAMSYAGAALAIRRFKLSDPTQAALGQQVAAAAMAAVAALTLEPLDGWRQSPTVWLALAGLSVVSTATPVILYFRLIRHVAAARAALVHYLIPVAAVVYGALLLNEPVTVKTIIGGVVVLAAVWTANSSGQRSRPERASLARRACRSTRFP